MKTYEYNEWKKRAAELFGDDPEKWRFVCAACGHVQTISDFLALGIDRETAYKQVHFSCIGRHTGDDGPGCDWTLGGLFSIHKVEVNCPEEEGKKIMAFEFDEPGAGPEKPFNGKKDRIFRSQASKIAGSILHFAVGRHTPLDLDPDSVFPYDADDSDYYDYCDVWDRFRAECEEIAYRLLKGEEGYEPGWESMDSFYKECEPREDKNRYRGEAIIDREYGADGGDRLWRFRIMTPDDKVLLEGTTEHYKDLEDEMGVAWDKHWGYNEFGEEEDEDEEPSANVQVG